MLSYWRLPLSEGTKKTDAVSQRETPICGVCVFPKPFKTLFSFLTAFHKLISPAASNIQIAISGKRHWNFMIVSTAFCEMVMGCPGIFEVQIINLTDCSKEGQSIESELFTSPLSDSHHSMEFLPMVKSRGEETAMARRCSPAQAKEAVPRADYGYRKTGGKWETGRKSWYGAADCAPLSISVSGDNPHLSPCLPSPTFPGAFPPHLMSSSPALPLSLSWHEWPEINTHPHLEELRNRWNWSSGFRFRAWSIWEHKWSTRSVGTYRSPCCHELPHWIV